MNFVGILDIFVRFITYPPANLDARQMGHLVSTPVILQVNFAGLHGAHFIFCYGRRRSKFGYSSSNVAGLPYLEPAPGWRYRVFI